MGRLLTFNQLKIKKGWPHSRQYTNKLVQEKRIPPPKKRPGGGVAQSLGRGRVGRVTTPRSPAYFRLPSAPLTEALVDALSADSVGGIVAAIDRLRAALEREGAAPTDVIVTVKERSAAVGHAVREATNTT